MFIRVGQEGKPAFQLRKGEEGLSVFDLEAVDPPLTESEVLDAFRAGCITVARADRSPWDGRRTRQRRSDTASAPARRSCRNPARPRHDARSIQEEPAGARIRWQRLHPQFLSKYQRLSSTRFGASRWSAPWSIAANAGQPPRLTA